MQTERKNSTDRRLAVEDVLLAVLGLAAGPVLWWMGTAWKNTTAASSLQTFEYWVGMVFGVAGLALCLLWLLYTVAGLSLIIAIATRNKFLCYWAELFTPKFLRRLIVAVIGTQLAFGAQAFAAPVERPEPSHTAPATESVPFMPSVIQDAESIEPTESPTPVVSSSAPSDRAPAVVPEPGTPNVPVAEPRQESSVAAEVHPAPSAKESMIAAPRQTSTLEVSPEPIIPAVEPLPQDQQQFLPTQPVVPSPYIAAPSRIENTNDPARIVVRGDCLWDIAHDELGADATLSQIDDRWRQWWEYNRKNLGNNPHDLIPGTTLYAPPFTN